jgi:hypothetical protein
LKKLKIIKIKNIFFFNCDALSSELQRRFGYDIDILLNLLAGYISKNNSNYNIIASHKFDNVNYENNIIFLKDILDKEQEDIDIIDFQLQSFYSDIIIGLQTGIMILCQILENKNKLFLMSYNATKLYPEIK